jgi:hypothetical protein
VAFTLRDIAVLWVQSHSADEVVDAFLLTKAQQLTLLKAYASALAAETQTRVNAQPATTTTLNALVADYTAVANS